MLWHSKTVLNSSWLHNCGQENGQEIKQWLRTSNGTTSWYGWGSLPLDLCSPTSKQECYVFNSRNSQLPAPVLRTSLSGVWGRQSASQATINANDSSLHVNSPYFTGDQQMLMGIVSIIAHFLVSDYLQWVLLARFQTMAGQFHVLCCRGNCQKCSKLQGWFWWIIWCPAISQCLLIICRT